MSAGDQAARRSVSGARRVLVLGATGNFGARISRRLAARGDIQLLVSSRDAGSAERHAHDIAKEDGGVLGIALNQKAENLTQQLRELAPDVVIHTAGPYQGQDYRVAEACIEAGCHYVDLADGREFVAKIGVLDKAARQSGVAVVSGASTLPTLPAAVIDHLRSDFAAIDAVQTCIAPAHRTPRGPGTVSAVLSYCGKPFSVPIEGQTKQRFGWQNLRGFHMPGLGLRLRAACDVPDFDVLPDYVEGLKTVEFHAALEAPWEHLALWSMAWLTRLGLVRSWESQIERFIVIGERLRRLGSETGGMRVRVRGTDEEGRRKQCEWHLVARRNHGPEIPCTPSIVVAEKLLEGTISPGAGACVGLLSLEEFEGAMVDFEIESRWYSKEG